MNLPMIGIERGLQSILRIWTLIYYMEGIQSIHISNRDTIEHILPKSPMNGSQWLT